MELVQIVVRCIENELPIISPSLHLYEGGLAQPQTRIEVLPSGRGTPLIKISGNARAGSAEKDFGCATKRCWGRRQPSPVPLRHATSDDSDASRPPHLTSLDRVRDPPGRLDGRDERRDHESETTAIILPCGAAPPLIASWTDVESEASGRGPRVPARRVDQRRGTRRQ